MTTRFRPIALAVTAALIVFSFAACGDDEHITAIAKLAYKRGSYGYALCD